MKPAVSYLGKAEKGRFVPYQPQEFKIAFCPYEGKEVVVTVDKKRNQRSTPQNKYYWGVVIPLIADAIGERDKEAVHDLLKSEFNFEMRRVGDKEIRVPQSTKDLEAEEFKSYIEQIQEWAASFLNVYIPDPDSALARI